MYIQGGFGHSVPKCPSYAHVGTQLRPHKGAHKAFIKRWNKWATTARTHKPANPIVKQNRTDDTELGHFRFLVYKSTMDGFD